MLHLDELIGHLFFQLKTLTLQTETWGSGVPLLQLPMEIPQSPIFSLLTPEPRSLARYCQEGGFVVRPIVPPTASSRVRVCLHSGNTFEDVERLVARIQEWLHHMSSTKIDEVARLGLMKSAL